MTETDRRRVFNELYSEYERRVYAYCIYVLGDRDRASDAFQEVFIKAYKSLHTVRDTGKLANWLFRIARNECLNAAKVVQRSDNRHFRIDSDDNIALKSSERTEFTDEIEHVQWALQQLPRDYREALVLAEFEGYSLKEIAELTGASLSNVKVRIFRAKQKLHNILQPILNDYE